MVINRQFLRKTWIYSAVKYLLRLLGVRRSWDPKPVPMVRLLCGGENGLSAAQYARHTGNFLRPSTPFYCSHYVKFLEQYLQIGDEIFRPEVFRKTAYFTNAVECIDTVGSYFTCTREEQVEQIARRFVAQFNNDSTQDDATNFEPYFPTLGTPAHVRPIEHSDCYEVVDGNHSLAIAFVRGETTYPVYVVLPPAITPLQQLLLDHAFLRGEPKLYQPITSPELEKWVLIRRCTDRFDMIMRFFEEHNPMPPRCTTYLDIACSYGWFVQAFGGLGFDAYGVEMDWAGVEVGRLVYGLKQYQVTRSDAVRFLKSNTQRYDVTSCFSLLHHFVLGRASISAEEMLRLIDRTTGTVLFFDMGQSHEEWFHETLAGWDADHIEQWLLTNSSFKKIYRLGKDCDNIQPFEENYGRTLFACMR